MRNNKNVPFLVRKEFQELLSWKQLYTGELGNFANPVKANKMQKLINDHKEKYDEYYD